MSERKTYNYLCCPFCGKTVETSHVKPSTMENFDISWESLQVREQHAGPGSGVKKKAGVDYGFKLLPEQCLTIEQMLADPKWHNLAEKVIGRVQLIHSEYVKAGLIKKRKRKVTE